jgi:NADPH:quinone reductase-like Zn-dependent oxidoreductase
VPSQTPDQGGHEQDGRDVGHAVHAREHALALVQSPVPCNASNGFGVNLWHMRGETDRMTGWVDRLMSLWEQGAIKPKIARTFPFDQAAAAHHFIKDRRNIGKVRLTH